MSRDALYAEARRHVLQTLRSNLGKDSLTDTQYIEALEEAFLLNCEHLQDEYIEMVMNPTKQEHSS